MGSISTSLIKARTHANTAAIHAARMRTKSLGASIGFGGGTGLGGLDSLFDAGGNQRRYSLYRGWVYSAIHALARAGAQQQPNVGRIIDKNEDARTLRTQKARVSAARWSEAGKQAHPLKIKSAPERIRLKAADAELDVFEKHPFRHALEVPNEIQYGWQFVYSFIANMALTGWGFIIGGETEDGDYEFYSVPTTWIQPDHTKGAFAEFRVVNPHNPEGAYSGKPLTRDNVAFAYFPNPGDPLDAMAPAAAQQQAIQIDDNIQSCQTVFFENGVFPSVIVTVGSDPHPDVPGTGVRPRLDATQRRQVHAAIKKVCGGVANFGNPAIVDGLIERIDRFSATQEEIGWERSEATIKSRILSAFGVHPFVLGEQMPGSYSQAYIIQDMFGSSVNTYLNLLGTMMTDFCSRLRGKDLLVWWDEIKPVDPQMERSMWDAARTRRDVTQNEYRTHVMGLPPDEDGNEDHIPANLGSTVVQIAAQVTGGQITPEQGISILEGLGLPSDLACDIAGDGPPEPPPGAPTGGMPGMPGEVPMAPPSPEGGPDPSGGPQAAPGGDAGAMPGLDALMGMKAATDALDRALWRLDADPDEAARQLLEAVDE